MGSKIHVVNKGEEGKVVFGVRDEFAAASSNNKPEVKSAFTSGSQAKQKVSFADMFISMSPAAKRIDASEHAEAKEMLAHARARLGDAKAALDAGKDADAIAIVDEALRNMTARRVRTATTLLASNRAARWAALLKTRDCVIGCMPNESMFNASEEAPAVRRAAIRPPCSPSTHDPSAPAPSGPGAAR